jgi:hypothetical protein
MPFSYIAGSCLFEGLFEHEPEVKDDMLEYFDPQCLHVYWRFSEPSYSSCLFEGLLEHEPEVRLETLE